MCCAPPFLVFCEVVWLKGMETLVFCIDIYWVLHTCKVLCNEQSVQQPI